ncbi:hypothetical protein WDU94_011205 [Cyamophila willieti]
MGQYLSEPETTKTCSGVHDALYKGGSCSMQGWRSNMEDHHNLILNLPDDPKAAFFAVYDGHGGSSIAEYAKNHLHKHIVRRSEYERSIVEAMEDGFLDIDQTMKGKPTLNGNECGSTAICILIKNNLLYCANVGDSRAIACVNGVVHPLSQDHKPTNAKEKKRILAAGGTVESKRVNGMLALSRALGDYQFKKNESLGPREQAVTALPDVIEKKLTPDWEFLVIACDGIWEVMSNQEVASFVRDHISRGMEPKEICEELMDHCIARELTQCREGGVGCDNMTVLIIYLLQGKTQAQLVRKCGRPPY